MSNEDAFSWMSGAFEKKDKGYSYLGAKMKKPKPVKISLKSAKGKGIKVFHTKKETLQKIERKIKSRGQEEARRRKIMELKDLERKRQYAKLRRKVQKGISDANMVATKARAAAIKAKGMLKRKRKSIYK